MNRLIVVLFCLINAGAGLSQDIQDKFSYLAYLEYTEMRKNTYTLLKQKKFQEALFSAQKLKCDKLYCREKYLLKALAYHGLKKYKLSKKYTLLAIEHGAEPRNIRNNFIGQKLHVSEKEIQAAYEKYIGSLNMKERKKFSSQIKDISELNNYLFQGKWPGINQIGHQVFCCTETPNMPRKLIFFSLYYYHYEKFVSDYFYAIVNQCEISNEDWAELEKILTLHLRSQLNSEKCTSLDFIFVKENGYLDTENSLLQLNVIARFLINSDFQIQLFAPPENTSHYSPEILKQIKAELIVLGVSPTNIYIADKSVNFYNKLCFKLL